MNTLILPAALYGVLQLFAHGLQVRKIFKLKSAKALSPYSFGITVVAVIIRILSNRFVFESSSHEVAWYNILSDLLFISVLGTIFTLSIRWHDARTRILKELLFFMATAFAFLLLCASFGAELLLTTFYALTLWVSHGFQVFKNARTKEVEELSFAFFSIVVIAVAFRAWSNLILALATENPITYALLAGDGAVLIGNGIICFQILAYKRKP